MLSWLATRPGIEKPNEGRSQMSTTIKKPRPRPSGLSSARLSAVVEAAYLLELASR